MMKSEIYFDKMTCVRYFLHLNLVKSKFLLMLMKMDRYLKICMNVRTHTYIYGLNNGHQDLRIFCDNFSYTHICLRIC
jgi:hypothetical protein